MGTQIAVLVLLKTEPEWRRFFIACCRRSPFHLRAQAWQFQDELRDRGHELKREELEDALFELARILLPNSPTAEWDAEWAAELASRALRSLSEHYIENTDLSVLEPWADRIDAAAMAKDRRGYREAIRGYVNAGLEAFEEHKRGVA